MTKNEIGCGVGNLVFTAAFLGKFKKVVGIDNLSTLVERGEKRMDRWNRFKESFSAHIQSVQVDWIVDDFILNEFWTDGSFLFLHWTAFSLQQRVKVSDVMSKRCIEGTQG